MFAKERSFTVLGESHITPIVVPSFSSRGFDNVAKMIRVASEYISDEILISAYDLSYRNIRPRNWTFPTLTFLDSGGYEKGAKSDLSDANNRATYPGSWTERLHRKVLDDWDFTIPTVAISYDNPLSPTKLAKQISRAKLLFERFPKACPEILLKAESSGKNKPFPSGFLNVDKIRPLISQITEFDIIGVTEKELGRSVLERMVAVARLRKLIKDDGYDTPIHVFGSLDPVTTPLYFLSGADIFDGLTWLRYAYKDGHAIYRQNYAVAELPIDMIDGSSNAQIHSRNYSELRTLEEEMKRFLVRNKYDEFKYHSDLMERCVTSLNAKLGDS